MGGVPWFPAWGLRFSTPVDNVPELISEIEEWRLDSRWSLISYEVLLVKSTFGPRGISRGVMRNRGRWLQGSGSGISQNYIWNKAD